MAMTDAILRYLEQRPANLPAASMGGYDRVVDGLNRLPRPFLAFGTLGMIVWGMVWPEDFTRRMQALEAVPEPLWWLMGAVVAFYFGARETHYLRARKDTPAPAATPERQADQAEGP